MDRAGETIETGAKLARWMLAADEAPRFVPLMHGGLIVLCDRLTWAEEWIDPKALTRQSPRYLFRISQSARWCSVRSWRAAWSRGGCLPRA